MREVKFRGKCLETGNWFYGSLLTNKLGAYIITEENPHECTQYGFLEISEYVKVDPKTVGQHTGLHDGNGTMIYEHDIFQDTEGFYWYVYFEDGFYKAKGGEYNFSEYLFEFSPHWCSVVGNIFEDGELIA